MNAASPGTTLGLVIVHRDGKPANDITRESKKEAALRMGERRERDAVIRWLVGLDSNDGHEWCAPIEYANGILAGVHRREG